MLVLPYSKWHKSLTITYMSASHLRHTRRHTNMYCSQWNMSRLGLSPNPKPLPPRVKKMPGRPKKNRRKDPSEPVKSGTKSSKVGTKIRCRRCGNYGHNLRTCSVKMVFTEFTIFPCCTIFIPYSFY